MENKKKKTKTIILLVMVILIIILLGLLVLSKINSNKKTNETNNIKDNKNILSEIDNSNAAIFDFEIIKKSEFSMDNDETCLLNCTYYNNFNRENSNSNLKFDFVKVEDNYLYWNVDGNWQKDKIIGDEIQYLYIYSAYNSVDWFMVYSNEKLYEINVKTAFGPEEFDMDKYELTKQIFESFEYVLVSDMVSIENVISKWLPSGCELFNRLYYLINNEAYIISQNKLVKFSTNNDYFNNIPATYGGCTEYSNDYISININGKINSIKNNDITIKYYIHNNNYDLLIDDNNNYYLYENGIEIKELIPMGTIESSNLDKSNKSLNIKINNKTIKINDILKYYY